MESSVKTGLIHDELPVDFMKPITVKGSRPDTWECHHKEDGERENYTGEMKTPARLAI